MANAYLRVVFRVGDEDARALEKGLSFFEASDLTTLSTGETIVRVGRSDHDFRMETEALPPRAGESSREAILGLLRKRYPAHEEEAVPVPVEAPRPAPVFTPEPTPKAAVPPPEPTIDKLTLDYLSLTASAPFLTVRERNEALSLSAWRGNAVKDEILQRGLAREVAINPGGRGERFKLLELTAEGRTLLSRFSVALPAGYGRGGIAHQWWANRIASWLALQGMEPIVEDASSGARVDLAFRAGTERIALEIELSDRHVVENVRKDTEAGFDRIVILAGELVNIGSLSAKLGELPPHVQIAELQSFEALIAPLLTPLPPVRRPNQNQEPRRRRRLGTAQTPSPRPVLDPFDSGALATPSAAAFLGLSPATLETLRCRGGGPPFVKLGRRVVYRREDLEAWITSSRRASTSAESAPKIRPT